MMGQMYLLEKSLELYFLLVKALIIRRIYNHADFPKISNQIMTL